MEKLNKDELFTLALHLDLPSLLNFCSSSRNINNILCLKNEIWIYKLNKDFPDFRKLNVKKSFKDLYQLLFSLTKLKEKLKRGENIYQLYNLEELYLDYDNLAEIPKEIGLLINLRNLYLNENRLTEIPQEISFLINLQKLDLSYNYLTKIPKEIGKLTNLQKLNLSGNQLTTIPKEMGNLTNLKELYLDYDNSTQIPKEIAENKNIEIYRH